VVGAGAGIRVSSALVYTLAALGLCAGSGLDRAIGHAEERPWFVGVLPWQAAFAAAGYVRLLVSGGVLNLGEAWEQRRGVLDSANFNGIIALTYRWCCLARSGSGRRAVRWDDMLRTNRRPDICKALEPWSESASALALAAASRRAAVSIRCFAPVDLDRGAARPCRADMISVSLVQAAPGRGRLVAHSRIDSALRRAVVRLLSLGVTALFLGALATQRDTTSRNRCCRPLPSWSPLVDCCCRFVAVSLHTGCECASQ